MIRVHAERAKKSDFVTVVCNGDVMFDLYTSNGCNVPHLVHRWR